MFFYSFNLAVCMTAGCQSLDKALSSFVREYQMKTFVCAVFSSDYQEVKTFACVVFSLDCAKLLQDRNHWITLAFRL